MNPLYTFAKNKPQDEMNMPYYPILSAPGFVGATTIYNFAPNNWERGSTPAKYLSAVWSDGRRWNRAVVTSLLPGDSLELTIEDIQQLLSRDLSSATVFTYLSNNADQGELHQSLESSRATTIAPAWRATLSLKSSAGAKTSYQGEIEPFPSPGSLLTFGHLIQSGAETQNFLLFINLEKNPSFRSGSLEIRDARNQEHIYQSNTVLSNTVNIVPLYCNFKTENTLVYISCRQMSGIPLFLSFSSNRKFLSLEHTHPPASLVIHGNRRRAQQLLKQQWL